MHLHCTQKLLKALAVPKEELAQPGSEKIFGWHAHIVSIARSKTIIAINDQNLFAVIMPAIKKDHLKKFSDVFQIALSVALDYEGFDPHHITFLRGDHLVFAKAHDRKVIGIINQIVKDIKYRIEDAGGWNFLSVLEVTKDINCTPWLAGTKNVVFPVECMRKDLVSLLH